MFKSKAKLIFESNGLIIKTQTLDFGYYLEIEYNQHMYIFDEEVARLIKMDVDLYRKAAEKFNATKDNNDEIYFKRIKDAKKMCEWLEYMLTLAILVGE